MFVSLFALLVIVILVYWTYKSPKAPPQPGQPGANLNLQDRDMQWREYIASFRPAAKQHAGIIDKILAGRAPDAPTPPIPATSAPATVSISPAVIASAAPAAAAVRKPHADLDGTLLLLYFGAFLFVAAAGLFVAFGGVDGTVRTLLVIMTDAILFGSGLWLFEHSRRLRPAGVAFTAISLAIAPLIGVASYYYVASEQSGGAIWFGTSVLCIVMYLFALIRLKSGLISYLLVLSLISVFESAISVVAAPVHYYVWMMILVGIGLRLFGFIRDNAQLERPSLVSAQVIIPLSIVASLSMIAEHGWGQVGVSLLLSAVFYGTETFRIPAQRVILASTAHILSLLGVVAVAYEISPHASTMTAVLLLVSLAHAVLIIRLEPDSEIAQNIAAVAFVAALIAGPIAYPNGVFLVAGLAVTACLGGLITAHQRRTDAYAGAAIALVALPFAIGQSMIQPSVLAGYQTLLCAMPFLALWAAWNWLRSHHIADRWGSTALNVYVIAGTAMLMPALFGFGGGLFIGACVAFGLSLMQVADWKMTNAWWFAAGIVVSLPVVREFGEITSPGFSAAVLIALILNIVLTLMCRAEGNRWLVAVLGMLLPLAIGSGGFGWSWDAVGYTYAYLFVVCGLVFCRGVAIGSYWVSSKIPILSYYRSQSASYVAGYLAAAVTVLLVSLSTADSRLHTSCALAVLALLAWYVATRIEQRKALLLVLPWFSMALIVSLWRPDISTGPANVLLLVLSAVAVISYAAYKTGTNYFGSAAATVLTGLVPLVFMPVFLAMSYHADEIVPAACLAAAGCLTLYHVWLHRQSERELAGFIIAGSVLWAVHAAGINNIQAYTHVIAATFAAYAAWRAYRGEQQVSDQYLYAMLATATIPLAAQALSGTAGDAYGWWLLLEQVGFMLLGIMISRKFVTFWGLYVAMGAVLYQLRHLGWAALSFLALFVIGIAIYRLTRVSARPE